MCLSNTVDSGTDASLHNNRSAAFQWKYNIIPALCDEAADWHNRLQLQVTVVAFLK